jgi:hypothetical protein
MDTTVFSFTLRKNAKRAAEAIYPALDNFRLSGLGLAVARCASGARQAVRWTREYERLIDRNGRLPANAVELLENLTPPAHLSLLLSRRWRGQNRERPRVVSTDVVVAPGARNASGAAPTRSPSAPNSGKAHDQPKQPGDEVISHRA